MLETIGFLLFLIGGAGFDSNGKGFWLAAVLCFTGLFFMKGGEKWKNF